MQVNVAAPRQAPAAPPITAGTPLVKTFTSGAFMEDPADQPGAYDTHDRLFAAAQPGTNGPVLAPGAATVEATVQLAAERARAGRGSNGVFPAQAIVHDAQSGALLIAALGGPTRHGSDATVGAIDGWSYHPESATSMHPGVVAIVGGETWADLSSGGAARFVPLPSA